jgi:UV DNA damage endonuclease
LNETITKRLGFCCKWIDRPDQFDGIKPKDDCKKYNTGSTTVAWLNRQTKDVAVEKLWSLMQQNLESCLLLVERVGKLNENLRMVRLSSDILPVYTEPSWSWFYRQSDVRAAAHRGFQKVGEMARQNNVRLSFHPGQYCVLASDNSDIVDRSIEEFEYHTDMARWMGYGNTWHDHGFKINVHLSGRGGAAKFINSLGRLSTEARNLITIENDEMANGLDVVLAVSDYVALVLDIHHHFIHSGEYINPNDSRAQRVLDSWRGVRPVLHYSTSREDCVVNHDPDCLPDLKKLLLEGHRKQKLRAHSDLMWNRACNSWALTFIDHWDIQVEAKGKNLATQQLYDQWISTK